MMVSSSAAFGVIAREPCFSVLVKQKMHSPSRLALRSQHLQSWASRTAAVALAGAVACTVQTYKATSRQKQARRQTAHTGLAAVATASCSRVAALLGQDGAGKSKVCAALLDISEEESGSAVSTGFADKTRLLEQEDAESRRNFTCYNHMYSQQAEVYHVYSPRLHLIDTPGHVDLLCQTEKALNMAHVGVLVCSEKTGLGLASKKIVSVAKESAKPLVIFFNRVDELQDEANFEAAIEDLQASLGQRPVVLFAPLPGSNGESLLNVLDGTVCTALNCELDLTGLSNWGSIKKAAPAEGKHAEFAERLREQLIETLSSVDDEVMEAYIESDGEVPKGVIQEGLRRATASSQIVPLIAGSAKLGTGIDALQEVLHELTGNIHSVDKKLLDDKLMLHPRPKISAATDMPFLGWVCCQRHVGKQHFAEVRVISGTLYPGQRLKAVGVGSGNSFEAEEIMEHGTRGELVPSEIAGPGDLILVKMPPFITTDGSREFLLADTYMQFEEGDNADTGDACMLKADHSYTYVLRLEELDKKAREHLVHALRAIAADDSGLCLHHDATKDEHLLSCMGMFHLELIRERLAEEFKALKLPLGPCRIPYRCTIRGTSQGIGKHELEGKAKIHKGIVHKKANRVDAWVKVELKGGQQGSGIVIDGVCELGDKLGNLTAEALERGIRQGLQASGPSGLPMVDVAVSLLDAEVEQQDAAKEAAVEAVRCAVQNAKATVVLEPIVDLEVDVGGAEKEAVRADLEQRSAMIVSNEEGASIISAEAPMRELVDYATDLQVLTHGTGTYSFHMLRYQEASPDLLERLETPGS